MKRLTITVAALFGLQLFLSAQLGDEWNVGTSNLSHVRFSSDAVTRTLKTYNPYFGASTTSANICNSDAEIILLSNGSQIADSNNRILKGGEQLLDSAIGKVFDGYNYSLPILQGCIFLPKRGAEYYMFYVSVSDSLWLTGREQPDRLYFAVIDLNGDNGKGEVISQKNLLYKGMICDGHLTAVRHGNGRDWWVVNNGFENNVLHKYLVTPDTVLGPFFQAIGTPRLEPDAVGMACFSKDGSKYAIGTANSLINVFDFDRCTGIFSNPKTFQSITESPWVNPYSNNSGCNGLCFSPNNKFLYVNSIYTIHQYDIEQTNIRSSGILFAKADSTYNWQQPFEASYLNPYNQIVLCNWGNGSVNKNMHVVEYPDLKGDSCSFKKEHLYSGNPIGVGTLPNMINYDLGALPGCDTFYTAVAPLSTGEGLGVRFYPNPAQTQLTIETNVPTTASVSVYDPMGKMLWQQTESHGNVNIDVQTWQAGLYVVVLEAGNEVITKKFLKE